MSCPRAKSVDRSILVSGNSPGVGILFPFLPPPPHRDVKCTVTVRVFHVEVSIASRLYRFLWGEAGGEGGFLLFFLLSKRCYKLFFLSFNIFSHLLLSLSL